MVHQGQTIELTSRGADGESLWADRYRTGGRDSKRVQRGGCTSEQEPRDALYRELERVRRERRITRRLSKAITLFGDRTIGELTSREIAEWHMSVSPGYRFEAAETLRQVLHSRWRGG